MNFVLKVVLCELVQTHVNFVQAVTTKELYLVENPIVNGIAPPSYHMMLCEVAAEYYYIAFAIHYTFERVVTL